MTATDQLRLAKILCRCRKAAHNVLTEEDREWYDRFIRFDSKLYLEAFGKAIHSDPRRCPPEFESFCDVVGSTRDCTAYLDLDRMIAMEEGKGFAFPPEPDCSVDDGGNGVHA